MNYIFHKRLKLLRKERNVNQIDLARVLNVTRATISAYETNKITPPYDKIKMLSDYFGVTIEYLVGEETQNGNSNNVNVAEILRNLLNELHNEENITINGVELDADSKELLINHIETSLKMSNILTHKN